MIGIRLILLLKCPYSQKKLMSSELTYISKIEIYYFHLEIYIKIGIRIVIIFPNILILMWNLLKSSTEVMLLIL